MPEAVDIPDGVEKPSVLIIGGLGKATFKFRCACARTRMMYITDE
jgi:hypothetical protein